LWIVGLITAVLTAIYMTRMMVMTFWGDERFHQELPVVENHDEPSRAEENAFATGDAHDDDSYQSSVISHQSGEAHGDLQGHDAHDDDDHDDEHHALPKDFHPHESPWTMAVPLVVLAVLSTLGGLVGIPYALSSIVGIKDANVFEHTLEPIIAKVSHNETKHAPSGLGEHGATKENEHSVSPTTAAHPDTSEHLNTSEHAEHSPEEIQTERLLAGLSLALAIAGIAIGWVIFRREPLKIMPKILQDKWRVDELYNGYIVNPLTNLSRNGLWKGFDVGFIDGIVNGIGHFVAALGSLARGVQVGFLRSYAAFILFGALIVIGYFIYYGFKLIS
jgi:NADH-quinone oxidoreductase subunit L